MGRTRSGRCEDAMSSASYASETKVKISIRPSQKAVKRAALALALALGVAGISDYGYNYLTTGRYLETTDDAYVKADSTLISPKVSGYIAQVLVGDNQAVKAGQLKCSTSTGCAHAADSPTSAANPTRYSRRIRTSP